ncbi:unnamed protein product [Ectocarpus sp. 12 AP-2014]
MFSCISGGSGCGRGADMMPGIRAKRTSLNTCLKRWPATNATILAGSDWATSNFVRC